MTNAKIRTVSLKSSIHIVSIEIMDLPAVRSSKIVQNRDREKCLILFRTQKLTETENLAVPLAVPRSRASVSFWVLNNIAVLQGGGTLFAGTAKPESPPSRSRGPVPIRDRPGPRDGFSCGVHII